MPRPSDDRMREKAAIALNVLQPEFQPLIDALYAAVDTTQHIDGVSGRLGYNTRDDTEEVKWFQGAVRLNHRLEALIEELQNMDGLARVLLGE